VPNLTRAGYAYPAEEAIDAGVLEALMARFAVTFACLIRAFPDHQSLDLMEPETKPF
jgi:hypothetical protein